MEPQEQSTQTEKSAWKASAFVTSVPLAILVAAAMVSGSILYIGSGSLPSAQIGDTVVNNDQATPTPVVVKNPNDLFSKADAVIGSDKAKVTIVEFSDFQCPFCRVFFNDTYSQIKKEYIDTGKVRLVFRHYPLPFHDAARPSALAAACAQEQGKFWQMHDKMFTEQAKKGTGTVAFGVSELKAWAGQIGLNTGQFNSCLDSAKYASRVDTDTADGSKFGVSGTPSFFINGELLVGAQPFAQFKTAIDAAL
jgi:protein-disulfide isomerase